MNRAGGCANIILRYVQKAPDDIRREIDRNEFDELIARALMGFHIASTGCAGGLGSQFLYNAYKHVLEGGAIPGLFAESRTVFIPKSSAVDSGRIVKSPEAPRRCLSAIARFSPRRFAQAFNHEVYTSFSEMYTY